MSDQTRISDTGELEVGARYDEDGNKYYVGPSVISTYDASPRTWDGEPLYSPETVQEQLFKREAFEQLKGQTTFHPEIVTCDVCNGDGAPCKECRGTGTILQTTTDNDA